MAIHLNIRKDILQDSKDPILHLMPCKIHGDESANVSSYFTPYIRRKDDELFETSFRGYPLQGKTVTVPKEYKGLIFYEAKKPESEEVERNLYTTGKFSKFTYWNYDRLPSKNDALSAALDWIDIAEALHSTVEDSSG